MSLVSDIDAAPFLIPTEHLEHRLGFSETTNCIRSLSHFRNDSGCWNFLYPKSVLNSTGHISNAGMLQIKNAAPSKIPRIHRLSTRRHRVLLHNQGA